MLNTPDKTKASHAAKQLAKRLGINLANMDLTPTGKSGQFTKRDVEEQHILNGGGLGTESESQETRKCIR